METTTQKPTENGQPGSLRSGDLFGVLENHGQQMRWEKRERLADAIDGGRCAVDAGFGIPGSDWDHVGCAACRGGKVLGCEPWHILIPCTYSRKSSDDLHELNRVDPPAQRWARFCEQHSLPNKADMPSGPK